ncbi:PqiC family protein [Candidatus Binatia bacterium]|nr:PqiC family protein [Candidatus Binatia bacterium]
MRTIREKPMRPSPPYLLRARALLLAAAALSLVTGCSYLLGVRTEPPRLFVLSTTPADGMQVVPPGTVLGFGPVDLPGYLDRRGIVRRIDANRLEESRTDLWAEPLGAGFKTTVEQNLRLRLPGVPLRTFPWPLVNQPDLAVAIEVSRFELTPGGTVELNARWSVRDPERGVVLLDHDAALVETVNGQGVEDVVAAMSRAAGALSDEIARAVAGAASTSPGKKRSGAR